MPRSVTVAIPTLDAGAAFAGRCDALAAQRLERRAAGVRLGLVGRNGRARAGRGGARVIEIEPRGVLARRHAQPADDRGAGRARRVPDPGCGARRRPVAEPPARRRSRSTPTSALAFGPYRPAPGREPDRRARADDWFSRLSPSGGPRIDRLTPAETAAPAASAVRPAQLLHRRQRLRRARGLGARAVPADRLRRGPRAGDRHAAGGVREGVSCRDAAVIHSHEYSAGRLAAPQLRRGPRDQRGVWLARPPADPATMLRNLRGNVGADWRAAPRRRRCRARRGRCLTSSTVHHGGADRRRGARRPGRPPARGASPSDCRWSGDVTEARPPDTGSATGLRRYRCARLPSRPMPASTVGGDRVARGRVRVGLEDVPRARGAPPHAQGARAASAPEGRAPVVPSAQATSRSTSSRGSSSASRAQRQRQEHAAEVHRRHLPDRRRHLGARAACRR